MDRAAQSSVWICLFTAGAVPLFACGGGSPSAVERLENAVDYPVTITGTVDVRTPPAPGERADMFFRFYEGLDTVMLEERQLLWSGSYSLDFDHELVCHWSVDVTIWDGRRSERKPVAPNPETCPGYVSGPDFWFP